MNIIDTHLSAGSGRRRLVAVILIFTLGLLGIGRAWAQSEPMKIGIIGTGRIGGALARHWVQAGYEVFMSSRHPEQLQP